MLRPCNEVDLDCIWSVINDGAQVYKGVIPSDRWREPYMSRSELDLEIGNGVCFSGWEENRLLVGVMGVQQVQDVTLIRHAYVVSNKQNQGIGSVLLRHFKMLTQRPILIGTWADATWAIRFYEKHGFKLVKPEQIAPLLRRYWVIPERQIETSVVLANVNVWSSPQDAKKSSEK